MRTLASQPSIRAGMQPAPDPKPFVPPPEPEDVLRQHVNGVFRFARSLGADRALAEDLTQEAFCIAYRNGKRQLPKAALGAYLRRSVRLLWLEHAREISRDHERREAAISKQLLQQWEAAVVDDGSEQVAAAKACVAQLQGRAAEAIELAYGKGESRERMAELLGMSPNGVKSLLARTRLWLEQCIRRKS